MTLPTKTKDLEAAQSASVQARAEEGRATRGLNLFLWATNAGELVPAWWSRSRDAALRRFWKNIDHLSGAVYTMESIISTIPFRVEPVDHTIKAHVRQAAMLKDMLMEESEFGAGWTTWVSLFVEDLITQDNGGFSEIVGDGRPDGPIVGPVLGIEALDSARCTRTGDPEFPVLYNDTDGRNYKLHRTRVGFSSQMPSPAVEMNRVGFCAVSRCVNVAQSLLDSLVYKQEKMGSRPTRNIMVTKGGLDPDDVRNAFIAANEAMNAQALRRYSKTVVVGEAGIPEADLQVIDLASTPDGYNEKESTTLAMAAIALAFGTDPRELFPGMTLGATRAEALIAHLKQRGKGPGQILETLERMLNTKVLPPHIKMKFDFQDDAQDEQQADIRGKRSATRKQDIDTGTINLRTAREQMLEEEELTQAQFRALELADGRLEDGRSVLSLFYDPLFADLLKLEGEPPEPMPAEFEEQAGQPPKPGQFETDTPVIPGGTLTKAETNLPAIDNGDVDPAEDPVADPEAEPLEEAKPVPIEFPTDTDANKPAVVLAAIDKKRTDLLVLLGTEQDERKRVDIEKALAALDALEQEYGGKKAAKPKPPALAPLPGTPATALVPVAQGESALLGGALDEEPLGEDDLSLDGEGEKDFEPLAHTARGLRNSLTKAFRRIGEIAESAARR
jgi:hypothetical protein